MESYYASVNSESDSCKRPYALGKRLEQSDGRKAKIMAAARAQLESGGLPAFTLEAVAQIGGVSRQTVHNLFKTKSGLLEALFDQIALEAGMDQMPAVMKQSDPDAMLPAFVEIFTRFWSRHRTLLRRIHGIAAVDPELGAAVEARNQRRKMAAGRIIHRLGGEASQSRIALLYSLTSFEFFDSLAGASTGTDDAAAIVAATVKELFGNTRSIPVHLSQSST
jgi:AcrR family transcriptional regulator